MKLSEIIANCGLISAPKANPEITAITADSRKVAPGTLFIAVRGFAADGHSYIPQALKAGAAAVVCEEIPEGAEGVFAVVENSRHALAIVASEFYGNPSRELTLVGITGTNGKTTTVTLLYNLFRSLGYSCGLLSTIANYVGERRMETSNTTSDPITINALLREMVDSGCSFCFMEVSSIGVEQERVAGLSFKAGLFSNLTHDHLDYHKTFKEYLRCKKLFFDSLGKDAYAIINIDDRNGSVMVQNTAASIITTSCRGAADHTCRIVEESFEGMMLRIDGVEVWTRLIGGHNAYNILAVYTTAVTLGQKSEDVLIALSSLEAASGRLETLRGPRDITVIIDYAHTPDALENVLKTLRDVAKDSEITCLFGCGGDRDRTKRPEMAQVAEKYADRIVITSDNSRSEDPEAIMEEIRGGLSPKGIAKTLSITSRKEAIRTAILTAKNGGAVLLAGKGHENYQIDREGKHYFNEKEIVEETFKSISVL